MSTEQPNRQQQALTDLIEADEAAGAFDPPGCERLRERINGQAREIARLRAALAQIAGPIRPDRYGTALHERMRQIAREALASEGEVSR